MWFFLLVLVIITAAVTFIYLDKKICTLRSQIFVLTHENNKLKENFQNKVKPLPDILYKLPDFKNGKTSMRCTLYSVPIENSISFGVIKENIPVSIIYSAEVSNELWYEISVPSLNNLNSNGWVKQNFIATF